MSNISNVNTTHQDSTVQDNETCEKVIDNLFEHCAAMTAQWIDENVYQKK